jgi:hypothetical protein
MMVEPDELADVHLEGVRLVSDDPKTWLIAPEIVAADNVHDWWERLHHAESSMSLTQIHLLRGIIGSITEHGAVNQGSQSTVHTATERLYETGMTIAQISELTGLSPDRLLGGPEWQAWQQLANGCPVEQVEKDYATIGVRTVQRFARTLAGNKISRIHPKTMHDEAFDLVAQGWTLRQVADELSTRYGVEVKRNTVGSWTSRLRNKQAKVNNVPSV